jgi:methionine sulfoxide reductase heme-binding subunit
VNNSALWYATRGAGVVSLLLLTAVVVMGILAVTRFQAAGWPRFLSSGLHRNLALLSVVFLAIHILTAVVDPFTALGWNAVLIPFLSSYRRFWLGLGLLSFDLMLAIVATSLLRRLIGPRTWRLVHWLTYAALPLALLHGIGTGSDTRFGWMVLLNAVCIAAVILAIAFRLQSQFRKAPSRMLLAEVINR